MERRSFIAGITLILPPAIAGCLDGTGEDDPANTREGNSDANSTDTEISTDGEVVDRETSTETNEPTTADDTPLIEGSPSRRLRIRSAAIAEGTVLIELTNVDTGDVVYETDYSLDTDETLDLDDRFEDDTSYRVTISNANESIFEQNIHSYEGYELEVVSNESVEVDYHEEV